MNKYKTHSGCHDKTLAFSVMNLDKTSIDWPKLKKELKIEFRKMSRQIHPDKCSLKDSTRAFQFIENSNRLINTYIDFKENGTGKNPFKEIP